MWSGGNDGSDSWDVANAWANTKPASRHDMPSHSIRGKANNLMKTHAKQRGGRRAEGGNFDAPTVKCLMPKTKSCDNKLNKTHGATCHKTAGKAGAE